MGSGNSLFNKKSEIKSNCEARTGQNNAGMYYEEFNADITAGMEKGYSDICLYEGIEFHNIPNMIKIVYKGLLAKSGAEEISAAIGYGDNSLWEDISSIPMQKTAQETFELLTFRKRPGNVNVAFKDNLGNWDNNSGYNYVFHQHPAQSGQ